MDSLCDPSQPLPQAPWTESPGLEQVESQGCGWTGWVTWFAWDPVLEWPGWGLWVTFTGARATLPPGHIPRLLPVHLMPRLALSAIRHLQMLHTPLTSPLPLPLPRTSHVLTTREQARSHPTLQVSTERLPSLSLSQRRCHLSVAEESEPGCVQVQG